MSSREDAITAVVAGGPDFASAVLPAVRSRAGSEPRATSDPREVVALFAERGGLLVVQYAGEQWLPILRDLRRLRGDGLSLVVAMERRQAAEVANVRKAGADAVVPWDGNPDALGWVLDRVLASRSRGGARAGPASSLPARAPAAGTPTPASAPDPAPPQSPSASLAAGKAWPASVPGSEEAAQLLAAVLSGATGEEGPRLEVMARAAETLSELERTAAAGGPLPVGTDVVRRAAGLRFRVALALASTPRPGEPTDAGAVQALLAEIDGVLAELSPLAEGAPDETRPALEAVRSALVREGFDLTEAVQRLTPPGPGTAGPLPRAAHRPARTETVRVLPSAASEGRSVPSGWLIVLALAALAAGGFHLREALTRPPPPEPPTFGGAPRNTVAVRDRDVGIVVPQPGKTVDPKEVEAFRRQEELRGNVVKEIAPGVHVSVPAAEKRKP